MRPAGQASRGADVRSHQVPLDELRPLKALTAFIPGPGSPLSASQGLGLLARNLADVGKPTIRSGAWQVSKTTVPMQLCQSTFRVISKWKMRYQRSAARWQ